MDAWRRRQREAAGGEAVASLVAGRRRSLVQAGGIALATATVTLTVATVWASSRAVDAALAPAPVTTLTAGPRGDGEPPSIESLDRVESRLAATPGVRRAAVVARLAGQEEVEARPGARGRGPSPRSGCATARAGRPMPGTHGEATPWRWSARAPPRASTSPPATTSSWAPASCG